MRLREREKESKEKDAFFFPQLRDKDFKWIKWIQDK